MSTVNYLLATWSGKRRNPSKDYLRAQIEQLRTLKHDLTQITVIIPEGSDDPDYYKCLYEGFSAGIGVEIPVVILHRPTNDRAYGQFLFAYDNEPGFDYYILVEDDYLPNLDNFDAILIDLLEKKKADYLCGSYGPVPGGKVDVPRHNIGIIKGSALNYIIAETPGWKFHPNGENDGQEQEMFADLCHAAGVKIADYSDEYPVPYFDRYLRYFSEKRGKETLFVPYQLLHCKAFGYHGEKGDENSHFLSTMEFWIVADDSYTVTDQGVWIGSFTLEQYSDKVKATISAAATQENYRLIKDRIEYECRGREVIFL